MRLLILTAILFAFGCADCPECPPQETACDFDDAHLVASMGKQHPVALDMDGDGWITPLDRGKWEAECQ